MGRDGFRLEDRNGLRLARCEALDAIPGVAHAFSTRVAFGRADFDLGPAGEIAPEVAYRREGLFRAAGPDQSGRLRQPPAAEGSFGSTSGSKTPG